MSTKAPVKRWAAFLIAAGLAATAVTGPAATDYYQPGAAEEPPPTEAMKPFVVDESAYKAFLFPNEIALLELFRMLNFDYDYGPSITRFSGSFVATPLRLPQHPKNSAFTAYVEVGKALCVIPAEATPEALASETEFASKAPPRCAVSAQKSFSTACPSMIPSPAPRLGPTLPERASPAPRRFPAAARRPGATAPWAASCSSSRCPRAASLSRNPALSLGAGLPEPDLKKRRWSVGTGAVEALCG